jgi:hypothetical protein
MNVHVLLRQKRLMTDSSGIFGALGSFDQFFVQITLGFLTDLSQIRFSGSGHTCGDC